MNKELIIVIIGIIHIVLQNILSMNQHQILSLMLTI
jgi:hypothetical protein